MTKERYKFVFENLTEKLTAEEMNEGWHFCDEFDGLLRKPADDSDTLNLKGEGFRCTCLDN